jgi:predicted RNA-binding Zn-ribbon protein involved in translation (DUF1610 family)
MWLSVACPACSGILRLSNDAFGKKVRCPKCGAVLVAKRSGGEILLQLTGISKTTATQPQGIKDDDGNVPLPTPVSWSKEHGESFFVVCPNCGFRDCLHAGFQGREHSCARCGTVFKAQRPSSERQSPSVPDAATLDAAQVKRTKACPFCGETILAVAKKCKHCGETISVNHTTSVRPSSLPMLVGCGIVAALLLAFGLTVALVVYFSVKPTEQAENKEVASDLRTDRNEPSRLIEERGKDHKAPERRQPISSGTEQSRRTSQERDRNQDRTQSTEQTATQRDAAPGELSKTLASMDRLTIAVPPLAPDEAPPPDVWDGHRASIRGVAFTDDGRFVVSVSGAIQKIGAVTDNSIRVWDARRGKQLRKLDDFREALDAVSVSPGGRFAVIRTRRSLGGKQMDRRPRS